MKREERLAKSRLKEISPGKFVYGERFEFEQTGQESFVCHTCKRKLKTKKEMLEHVRHHYYSKSNPYLSTNKKPASYIQVSISKVSETALTSQEKTRHGRPLESLRSKMVCFCTKTSIILTKWAKSIAVGSVGTYLKRNQDFWDTLEPSTCVHRRVNMP